MTATNPAGRGTTLASVAPLVLCVAFFWPSGGGARKVHMLSGSVAPGASGTVQVNTGNSGNTTLDVKAYALDPPSSLTPAENVYVLWIQAPGWAPQNEGPIAVNASENGELHIETPYKNFRVFITAEDDAGARAPIGPKVLSADVSSS